MNHMLEALKRLELKRADQPPRPAERVEPRRRPEAGSSTASAAAGPPAEPQGPPEAIRAVTAAPPLPGVLAPSSEPIRGAAPFDQQIARNLGDKRLGPQYRNLLKNIQADLNAPRGGAVLMTSVEPTSLVAETLAHLAQLLAENDLGQVLLVDANLREKPLSRCFQADGCEGASEALRGRNWATLVLPLAAGQIGLLPAGRRPPDGPLADPQRPDRLLDLWKRSHRFVLLDAGSADAELVGELGPRCDAAYLLVQLGTTDSAAAARAAAGLRAAGTPLRGCVVIGFPEAA